MAPYTSHVIRPTVNKDIRQDDKPNQPCFLFFVFFEGNFLFKCLKKIVIVLYWFFFTCLLTTVTSYTWRLFSIVRRIVIHF